MNAIYLTTIGKGVEVFAQEQTTTLFDIANQCPMLGGNAVFKARALYGLVDETYSFDDSTLCALHGIEVKRLAAPKPNAVAVIPSPAVNEATLVLTDRLDGPIAFVLYDALGAEAMRLTIPAETPRFSFSTTSLPPALYHYDVRGQSGVVGNGKLTIVR